MTDLRIWHASRDPYHCAFRSLRLLIARDKGIEIERLRILDMFLLYPSLLHRISMPRQVRDDFLKLRIEKPENIFVRLPSPASVFQDLRIYQNSAVTQLAAKGLISSDSFKQGIAALTEDGTPIELRNRAKKKNFEDNGLTDFLVGPFSTIPLRGRESIYRKAGLPSRKVTA